MPKKIDYSLISEADLDQSELLKDMITDNARRARGGTLIYPTLWLIIGLSSGWYQQQWLLFFANFIGLTLFACLRMWIIFRVPEWVRESTTRGSVIYLVALLSNALHWGVITAMSVYCDYMSLIATPMLLSACGVAAAGTSVLAIDSRVRYLFPTLVIAPVIIALLWNLNETNLLLAALCSVFALYLIVSSRSVRDDYWTALRTTKLLKSAAEEFRRLSNTDPLTQLYNRLYFEEKYQQEWRRCSRNGQPLSIALIDLDHFKQINDTHGHVAGDRCLLQVADILRTTVRRTGDVVARFGGEEFIILLPNTNSKSAEMVANRLREAIFATPAVVEQQTIELFASIGVATTVPQQNEDSPQLIKEADRALYRAKEKGRNRVETIAY